MDNNKFIKVGDYTVNLSKCLYINIKCDKQNNIYKLNFKFVNTDELLSVEYKDECFLQKDYNLILSMLNVSGMVKMPPYEDN